MPFQCPTLGACAEVGNYMSYPRVRRLAYSPPMERARRLAYSPPMVRLVSSLIRALFRRHPFTHYTTRSDDGGNESEILYENPLLDDTRLVLISLYAL